MTLKDSVQTVILVVGFFSLLVFGASYYFVLIDPDSSNYPLKEALSITASFFGGFATLTAAYIASKLFNDWRETEDFKRTQNLYDRCLSVIYNSTDSMEQLLIYLRNRTNKKEIPELIKETLDATFEIIAVIGMDYNDSIKKDNKLRELFEVLLEINQKFRKYYTREHQISFIDLDIFSENINSKLDKISFRNIEEYNHYLD